MPELFVAICKIIISGYVLLRFVILAKQQGGFWRAVHHLRRVIFEG